MELNYQKRLCQACEQRGIALSTAQRDGLTQYLTLLLRWRPHLNLTGLRDAERMLDVLIVESLDFLQGDFSCLVCACSISAPGAGVPGIPLAICRPDVHVTLLDRSEKKITFLRRVVASLPLENCQPCCSTAEDLAHRLCPQEYFDVVVSRGVGVWPTSCASPHRSSNREADSSYASPSPPEFQRWGCWGWPGGGRPRDAALTLGRRPPFGGFFFFWGVWVHYCFFRRSRHGYFPHVPKTRAFTCYLLKSFWNACALPSYEVLSGVFDKASCTLTARSTCRMSCVDNLPIRLSRRVLLTVVS